MTVLNILSVVFIGIGLLVAVLNIALGDGGDKKMTITEYLSEIRTFAICCLFVLVGIGIKLFAL